MSSPSDKRTDPRFAAHFDVRFSRAADASRALNAFSVNFSSGGICVRTKTGYLVGEMLSLELTIERETFELSGVVSWVRGDAVGIRFVNVSPSNRTRLQNVAKQLSSTT